MAYIGNQPGYGKPEVFVFTASGGETSVSTADDGRSINYAVGYVSVYLNGVLLVDGTDYTATNGSSITGLSALVASDVVTVVSFETFAIPDAVSEQDGGAFLGDVTVPNLLVGDGNNIGSVSDPDAISIAAGGDVSFSQDITVKDGGTIGSASDPDAISVASGGVVTFSQGIKMAAGKGIDFDAYGSGTDIDSNLLDDYEEGTWTPEAADAETGGNVSSTSGTGYYTKIGRLILLNFSLNNINTSGMTSGNTFYIRDLPFRPVVDGSLVSVNGTVYANHLTLAAGEITMVFDVQDGEYVGQIRTMISGSGAGSITVGDINSNTTDLRISLTYTTG